jgi:hypothetical protein
LSRGGSRSAAQSATRRPPRLPAVGDGDDDLPSLAEGLVQVGAHVGAPAVLTAGPWLQRQPRGVHGVFLGLHCSGRQRSECRRLPPVTTWLLGHYLSGPHLALSLGSVGASVPCSGSGQRVCPAPCSSVRGCCSAGWMVAWKKQPWPLMLHSWRLRRCYGCCSGGVLGSVVISLPSCCHGGCCCCGGGVTSSSAFAGRDHCRVVLGLRCGC